MCKEINSILNSEYYDMLSHTTPHNDICMQSWITKYLPFFLIYKMFCFHLFFTVEWMIANPPIIFGKTAQLSCITITPSTRYNTHNVTSWLGGKDYSTLTYTGGNTDPRKYAEIRRWHRSKFESILQIYKFDEMDVNVDYSCSIGGDENRKSLSLALDKFEC